MSSKMSSGVRFFGVFGHGCFCPLLEDVVVFVAVERV